MVVSQNWGPQYRPQITIVLIIGTPTKVPLILGNPYIKNTKILCFCRPHSLLERGIVSTPLEKQENNMLTCAVRIVSPQPPPPYWINAACRVPTHNLGCCS